jgi:D-alanyl-D-alanine dipeptidase
MDARSEALLAHVDPALAALVRAAATVLQPHGTFLCVYQGFRTVAQQDDLYAQGRTKPGHIVTNARGGYSNHNYGMAVDVVPYLSGDGGALNWDVKTPQYHEMVMALKGQGLEYGGDWIHFPDNDHFQLATMPASPTAAMIADLRAPKAMTDIWARCAAGGYMTGTVQA